MEIKNDAVVEVEESLDLPVVVEGQEDTTDWKAEATKLREKAIKQRERTKVLKEQLKAITPEKKPEAKPEKKSDELDYGQKAYLKSSGFDSSEFEFVKNHLSESGKDLDALLTNGYFQSELKSMRDAKSVAQATPGSTRGSEAPSNTKVDFWIAKGQLPDDFELRAKVVNEKIRRAREARGDGK